MEKRRFPVAPPCPALRAVKTIIAKLILSRHRVKFSIMKINIKE